MSERDEVLGVSSPYRDDIDVDEILRLEQAVIEAAINCKLAAPLNIPMSEYGFSVELEQAVCNLLKARSNEGQPN